MPAKRIQKPTVERLQHLIDRDRRADLRIPTVANRLREAAAACALLLPAVHGSHEITDSDFRGALLDQIALISGNVYWLTQLSDQVLELPAPDDDQKQELETLSVGGVR